MKFLFIMPSKANWCLKPEEFVCHHLGGMFTLIMESKGGNNNNSSELMHSQDITINTIRERSLSLTQETVKPDFHSNFVTAAAQHRKPAESCSLQSPDSS